jgi:hypothetical protein
MKAPKIDRPKATISFRTEMATIEVVHSLCEELQHKRSDVLDMLIREALIARGKIQG